ncbi:hypothetical protein DPMN_154156 [Dreissena polymorpha]|uniref:Uncharacterized protein n=1 Tax=Dreissena polymorpha TaxID=45954 RepID=A0A9D4J9L7_DREPO|nr:hypothetical protein DPMN_154156 [Dreissena polymorpha]
MLTERVQCSHKTEERNPRLKSLVLLIASSYYGLIGADVALKGGRVAKVDKLNLQVLSLQMFEN